jgi:hypothetical protein
MGVGTVEWRKVRGIVCFRARSWRREASLGLERRQACTTAGLAVVRGAGALGGGAERLPCGGSRFGLAQSRFLGC